MGHQGAFDLTRTACVNCHAPANVLDLVAAAADDSLGVECTPNLWREPRGVIPSARLGDTDLGVDCTSCHVGTKGIAGSGRHPGAAHG